MNKACRKKNHLNSLIFFACLILFNLLFISGCGLDTYYIIDAPPQVINEPLYSSIEAASQYFEFTTAEKTYSGIKFLGTDVYYKIYRSSSRLETETSNIKTIAGDIETATNAPTRLIETYKYQPLEMSHVYGDPVFIPAAGYNRTVRIRLSDRDPYKAEVLVNGKTFKDPSAVPVRSIVTTAGDPTFTFSSTQPSLLPKSGDEDVDYSSTGNDNEWYVAMFAIAVAQDSTYTPIYSNVLYLGSVTISVK